MSMHDLHLAAVELVRRNPYYDDDEGAIGGLRELQEAIDNITLDDFTTKTSPEIKKIIEETTDAAIHKLWNQPFDQGDEDDEDDLAAITVSEDPRIEAFWKALVKIDGMLPSGVFESLDCPIVAAEHAKRYADEDEE